MNIDLTTIRKEVASYVGAWIETGVGAWLNNSLKVASYVGAWIETEKHDNEKETKQSHPTWVRGLKLLPYHFTPPHLSRILRGCVD